MNRPLLLALAAVSLTHAQAALAGSTCGGGGGGSSSGDSDSGSSSSDSGSSFSDSSSDSGSSAPACTDETDIVGYRRCTRYGRWSSRRTVPVLLEFGTATRRFASPLREATGSLSHENESFTYRVVGQPSGSSAPAPDAATVTTARLGVGLPRGLYLAAEVELGGLSRTAGRAEMTSAGMFGAPSITPTSSVVAGTFAVAGIHGALGAAGRTSLGAEVAGGVRSITYNYESRYLSCVSTTSHAVSSPILEARARAQLWLSPFVNLGASAGASVLDRGAWMAGLHLGFATKAYANLRD
jgi:hypothetical protein